MNNGRRNEEATKFLKTRKKPIKPEKKKKTARHTRIILDAKYYLVTFLMLTHSLSKTLNSRKHLVALTHSNILIKQRHTPTADNNFRLCRKKGKKKQKEAKTAERVKNGTQTISD